MEIDWWAPFLQENNDHHSISSNNFRQLIPPFPICTERSKKISRWISYVVMFSIFDSGNAFPSWKEIKPIWLWKDSPKAEFKKFDIYSIFIDKVKILIPVSHEPNRSHFSPKKSPTLCLSVQKKRKIKIIRKKTIHKFWKC